MTSAPLVLSLVRKGTKSLETARELQGHDADGAVNRAYYAIFNLARAALLTTGMAERDLPRTHNGLIAAFSERVVQSGRIDPESAATSSRIEALRLRADYTAIPVDADTAADAVAQAESFVRELLHEFSLDSSGGPSHDKVSEPRVSRMQPSFSLEEERRRAREKWLRLRRLWADQDRERQTDDRLSHDDGLDLSG